MSYLSRLSLICCVIALTSCGPAPLNETTAKRTLDGLAAPGTTKITGGIHEVPQLNVAMAEVEFTGFAYKDRSGTPKTFTGRAQASFQHNMDGKWVLVGVQLKDHPIFADEGTSFTVSREVK